MASIIIPGRDEAKFIGMCLESVFANDYPKERLEILVVDGMGEDGTRKTVEGYALRYPFIRLLGNKAKVTFSLVQKRGNTGGLLCV